MTSATVDSLRHFGAVIVILGVTKLTHKEAYKDITVVIVNVPIITTVVLEPIKLLTDNE